MVCWRWRAGADRTLAIRRVSRFAAPNSGVRTHLWQTHALQELQSVVKLILLAGGVPSELLSHQVDHTRQRIERRLNVQERQTGTTGDKVGGPLCVLDTTGVTAL